MTGRPPHDHHHHGACDHARDRAELADHALEEAEALCRQRGARLTPIRREVLETLLRTHRPLGAYDLVEAMRGEDRRTLAPITIYRALDFLMEQGLVHRLASRNAFVACPHGHAPEDLVAFLICEGCGGVDELSSDSLSRSLAGIVEAQGFAPRVQVLEITGRCGHCREG